MITRIGIAAGSMMLRSMAVALALLPMAGAALAQEDGQLAFNNHCRTCHTTDEGDHRIGPSLYNVVGREAGSLPDYAYSDPMRDSTIVWDEENLDRFIENPEAVVPGNNMQPPFAGISDPKIRATIIGFLQEQSVDDEQSQPEGSDGSG